MKLHVLRTMLSLVVVLMGLGQVSAQMRITGKVMSATDNSPLPGARILIKNTTTGVLSDESGAYVISAKANDILVFSYLGFVDQEITVMDGKTTVDVLMAEEEVSATSEVVITALGIRKEKSRLGYAVQDVDATELVKAREPNALNSLVGKVSGLTVGASPELLGAPSIALRKSIPLIVVDGVPINSDSWNISADDIEKYTVLKGPAASALYGYRGQNGALIITTKKGTASGRGFSIEFNSSQMIEAGFNAIPKVQDEYGPGDHGHYAFQDGRGGGFNDGDYDVWGPRFEGQLIPQYDGKFTPDQTYTTTYPDGATFTGNVEPTPYVARGADNLVRFLRPGFLSNNNIAIASSTDRYDLRFSTSFNNITGIVPNTHLGSVNFNLSSRFDFNERISMSANINYNRQFTDNIPDVNYGPNSMIYNIIIWGGADWDVDELRNYWQPGKEGTQQIYAEYQRYNNPWFLAKEWLRGHYKTDIYGYTTLNWKIAKGLDLLGRTAVTTYDILRTEKFPYSATVYGREEARGDYREDRRSLFENNTDVLLTYDKTFGDNGLGIHAIVGGNVRTFQYNSSYVTTNYLNVPGVYTFSNSAGAIIASNYSAAMQVLSGLYSVDISASKYANIAVAGRWDKISTLPEGNNLYFYPSVGLSTLLTDYLTLPSVIDYVKVRASYANVKGGLTQQYIGATPLTSYPLGYGAYYNSTYDGPSYENAGVYSTPLVYDNQPGAFFTNTIVNPDLQPFNRANAEAGIEARFFQNRLGFDVTYFNNIDGPRIFSKPISTASGYSSQLINAVKTRTYGLEFTVSATPLKSTAPGALNWEILFNGATLREVYTELPEGIERLNGFYQVGDRVDAYYDRAFVKNPEGQIVFDASGRPLLNPVSQFLGYADPNLVWGVTNVLSWKNIRFSFQFDGRAGGVLTNYIQRQTFRGGRHIETVSDNITDVNGLTMGEARLNDTKGIKSWVGEGVVISNGASLKYDQFGNITNQSEIEYAPNTTPTFLQDYISRYYSSSEGNLMSKTFSKLREVTLTYNFPTAGNKTFKVASVSLVGRNLLYFAEKKDIDLDQYIGNNYSGLQTPTTKRYGINLNFNF
ncbi:MAG: SusC/RagA family TonB-linked outer membrane protein [Bacteroidia bacterium]|nr:SusC/RagA family TonB-linked outer membrane protein [Bacteroidia bacterium]